MRRGEAEVVRGWREAPATPVIQGDGVVGERWFHLVLRLRRHRRGLEGEEEGRGKRGEYEEGEKWREWGGGGGRMSHGSHR